MAPNTTVALMMAAAGGVLVWTGIANPEGGVVGALGSVLRGEPVKNTPAVAGGVTRFASVLFTGAAAAPATAVNASVATATGDGSGAAVVTLARAQIGTPYAWGEEEPGGFDCSGLSQYCFKTAAGLSLPRTAAQQALTGTNVPLTQLAPGDLVFWGAPAHHVAIASSASTVIHAPGRGKTVVERNLWGRNTAYARRVLGGAAKTRTITA